MKPLKILCLCACLTVAPGCSFDVVLDPEDPTVAAIMEAAGDDDDKLAQLLEEEWEVGIERIKTSLDGTKTAIIENFVTDVAPQIAEKIGQSNPLETGGFGALVALLLGGGALSVNNLRKRYELKKKARPSK
jgi:hypothetical protein